MTAKGADAFRSIGEAARLVGVAPHVLRYWESQFPLLRPVKRADGRRYYRPDDVRLAAGLAEVLREDGMTIRGARKLLARDRGEAVRARGAARLAGLVEAEADAPGDRSSGLAAFSADARLAGEGEGHDPLPPAPAPVPAEAASAGGDGASPPLQPATPAPPVPAATSPPPPRAEAPRAEAPRPQPPPAEAPAPRRDAGPAALPLFPDLAPATAAVPPAEWLAHLTALGAALRARPAGAAPAPVRAAGQRLHDAICAHF